jgi:hypothetical protein
VNAPEDRSGSKPVVFWSSTRFPLRPQNPAQPWSMWRSVLAKKQLLLCGHRLFELSALTRLSDSLCDTCHGSVWRRPDLRRRHTACLEPLGRATPNSINSPFRLTLRQSPRLGRAEAQSPTRRWTTAGPGHLPLAHRPEPHTFNDRNQLAPGAFVETAGRPSFPRARSVIQGAVECQVAAPFPFELSRHSFTCGALRATQPRLDVNGGFAIFHVNVGFHHAPSSARFMYMRARRWPMPRAASHERIDCLPRA